MISRDKRKLRKKSTKKRFTFIKIAKNTEKTIDRQKKIPLTSSLIHYLFIN